MRAMKAVADALRESPDLLLRDAATGAVLAEGDEQIGETLAKAASRACRAGFSSQLEWRGVRVNFTHGRPAERVSTETWWFIRHFDGLTLILLAGRRFRCFPVPAHVIGQPGDLLAFVRERMNQAFEVIGDPDVRIPELRDLPPG